MADDILESGEMFGEGGDNIQMTEAGVVRYQKQKEQMEKAARQAARKKNPVGYYLRNYGLPYVFNGAVFGAATYGFSMYATGAPDLQQAFTVAAIAYPLIKTFEYTFKWLGFAYGHLQNITNRDRFREIKMEPRGRGFGVGFASALLLLGGVHINDYGKMVADAGEATWSGIQTAYEVVSEGIKARESKQNGMQIVIPEATEDQQPAKPALPAPN